MALWEIAHAADYTGRGSISVRSSVVADGFFLFHLIGHIFHIHSLYHNQKVIIQRIRISNGAYRAGGIMGFLEK